MHQELLLLLKDNQKFWKLFKNWLISDSHKKIRCQTVAERKRLQQGGIKAT